MAVERTEAGRRVIVRPAGISPNNAFAAASRAFDKVTEIGSDLQNIAGRALLQRAEREGAEAGALAGGRFDENGNLLPLEALPDRGTAYGEAYARAAVAAYGSNVVNTARARATQLQAEMPADPEGFEGAYGAWLDETLGAVDPTVRALIEGDLRAIGTQTGSQVLANRIEMDRKQQLADIQLNAENMANEVLQLAELGQGGSPRAQELIAKQAGLWKTAADAELVTQAEAAAQVQKLSQGIQLQTTLGAVQQALAADDEAGAREIMESLRTDTEIPLDPDVRDRVLAVGDRLLDDWWREKEKKRIQAERALAEQRERKAFGLAMRLRDDPASVKPQEIIEAGLSASQTLQLLGAHDSAIDRIRERELRLEESKVAVLLESNALDRVGLTNLHKAGKISPDFYFSTLQALERRDQAVAEKLREEAEKHQLGMAKYSFIDLERSLPWDPAEVDAVYAEAMQLGILAPEEAAGRKEQYLNRWRVAQREGTLQTAMDKLDHGQQTTDHEMEELFIASPQTWDALNPENHELIAGRVLAGRNMPTALKRQFQSIGTSAATDETLTLLALYDRIAADERGRYIFQKTVGIETAGKIEQIAELDRDMPNETFGEVMKTAVDGFSTRATSANRNLAALGETPSDQRTRLTDTARARIIDAIDDNDGIWSAVFGRDPRFATFATELAGQGISVDDLEPPDEMVNQVARTAQRLIERGVYTPDKLDKAVDQAVSDAWGTWGAQQDGDGEWRLVQFPITRYAQQTVPTGVPFRPSLSHLKEDLAFKLDSAGVKALDGKDWNDLEYRFIADPRTLREEKGPRYKVQFEDQYGAWRELPIRYRFDWKESRFNDDWRQAVSEIKDSALLETLNALTFGVGGKALAPAAARQKLNAIAESYVTQDKAYDFVENVNGWLTWLGFDAVPPPAAFKDRKFFEPSTPLLGQAGGMGQQGPISATAVGSMQDWLDSVFGEIQQETAE